MLKTKYMVQAAVIAAVYVVLTLTFAPISYGNELIEVRISEVLTVLPYFTPAAVPGLFVGCLISNLFSPMGTVDIIVGSLATLIAAYLSYKMPKKYLVPIPPIVVNGLIIGAMLHYVYKFTIMLTIFTVTAGQIISCYVLGYPLMLILERIKYPLFNKK